MLLLISDANILIDMETGNLMETLFRLPMQFAIPDLMYWEEIEPGTPGLEALGLRVLEVSGEFVAYTFGLLAKYGDKPRPLIPVIYITGNTHPDHNSINTFRKRFLGELGDLFVQILLRAYALGALKLGDVSLDECRMSRREKFPIRPDGLRESHCQWWNTPIPDRIGYRIM